MADIVNMPKLGFDMAEGALVRWVVAEGAHVEKGQVLAEIETDKATVEVESGFSGVVLNHLVQKGDVVPVNQPIAVIGSADETIDLNQLLGGILPTKAEKEAPSEKSEKEQGPVPVSTETKISSEAKISAEGKSPQEGHLPDGVRASPIARKLAEERGIDIMLVKGSGPQGRIVRSDVEAYESTKPSELPAPATREEMAVAVQRTDRHVPVSRLRSAIGRRMVQAKQQIPHFYVSYQYNVTDLITLRSKVNAVLPEEEKTSLNDYLIKAVALTLRDFPNLNATLDENANEVIQFGAINIGVAVAVENGLLTVVCRNADLKTVRQIALEVKGLVSRARQGKVKSEDIEGSTFSISNLGMYGVDEFIAIINPPEAAILAIGSASEIPVIVNGEIKTGQVMKAIISVDHRVSDGVEAARFLQALGTYLELPYKLVMF
jgi:pyruvate dehydrogenase E2 component (dihydrolipoyllysine-residue acetyltransferase)